MLRALFRRSRRSIRRVAHQSLRTSKPHSQAHHPGGAPPDMGLLAIEEQRVLLTVGKNHVGEFLYFELSSQSSEFETTFNPDLGGLLTPYDAPQWMAALGAK